MLRAGGLRVQTSLVGWCGWVVAVKQLKSAHIRSKSRMLVRHNSAIDVKMWIGGLVEVLQSRGSAKRLGEISARV